MLEAVNFCINAIDKKAIRPEQQCFLLNNGLLFATNEKMTLCHDINIPVDCQPNAAKFTAMIRSAVSSNDIPAFTITPTGKLSVRAGKLKSLIDCHVGNTQIPRPEGIDYQIDGDLFVKCLKTILPFVGTNTAYLWTNGALLSDNYVYATNNVTMVRHSTNFGITKRITIPASLIKEILRVKESPVKLRYCDKSITVFYSDTVWIKSRLLEDGFPKSNIDAYFKAQSELIDISTDFVEALSKIKPFIDDTFNSVNFTENGIQTTDGSSIDIDDMFCSYGSYNYAVLKDVLSVATKADFAAYPRPVIFEGDNIVGTLVGLRR